MEPRISGCLQVSIASSGLLGPLGRYTLKYFHVLPVASSTQLV